MYAVDNQNVGFLPGDISEKIDPWTQPIWDCIEKIETSAKGGGKNGVLQNRSTIVKKYESIIDIQPITFIRGRTLNNQYVIIDDAQSLDKGVLLDIFSRLGEDTKIVCTFDLSQNDNKFISRQSSILSLIDRLKTEPCFAHMDFVKSERSALAQLAAKILEEN
jgi:PhoH-like ATPase